MEKIWGYKIRIYNYGGIKMENIVVLKLTDVIGSDILSFQSEQYPIIMNDKYVLANADHLLSNLGNYVVESDLGDIDAEDFLIKQAIKKGAELEEVFLVEHENGQYFEAYKDANRIDGDYTLLEGATYDIGVIFTNDYEACRYEEFCYKAKEFVELIEEFSEREIESLLGMVF